MTTETWVLALSILSSSFIGSWHCAGMCGPIASLIAHNGNLKLYHAGRGIGYILLGIFAGWIGQFFLQSEFYWIRIISGVVLTLTLLWMGLNLIFLGKNFTLKVNSIFSKLNLKKTSSFSVGLLSMFLPCGWLYTYVLGAASSQSPYSGALIMLLFWLGSLPALSAFPVFLKKSILLSNRRKQKIAGFILVGASFYALGSFYFLHSL